MTRPPMITRPLNLAAHLRPPPRNLDALFYVNVALLGLFFVVFGSRFVLAPGITFSLPESPGAVDSAQPTDLVVNMQRDNIILFEGGRYSLEVFKQRLADEVKAQGAVRLLLRADRQTSVEGLQAFIAVAMAAGCGVQLAADTPAATRVAEPPR